MPKQMNTMELQEMRNCWEEINAEMLSEEKRNVFQKRKRAVDLYIDGTPLKTVSDALGMPPSEVLRFVKRCTQKGEDGRMLGYCTLIPSFISSPKERDFEKLLQKYPSLKDYLIGNFFGDSKYTLEHKMNYRTLHAKFLRECQNLGVQDYDYPLSTKNKGYNSMIKYIKNVANERSEQAIKRESKDAQQRFLSTGFGISNSLQPFHPYNVVQIDGHKVDLIYSVKTEGQNGEDVWKHAMRPWLITVIDVASRAILGYHITANENYNQYDVLKAIKNCIEPHRRMKFHRSFSYPEKGGFPSEYCPSLEWATFDMIMLDNAKSHLAKNVVSKLTDQLHCTVNFGSVATPESRGIIERFFKTLETNGYHRLPGTTGSNSRDTKRREPEQESIKYQIRYEDIVELTEYLIAKYNNSAHSSLNGQTPLQVIQRRCEQVGMKPYILSPNERVDFQKILNYTMPVKIQGGYKTGGQPRINFMNVQYHAEDCRIPMSFVKKQAMIEINPDDISHLLLFDMNGKYIARLVAAGEWGKIPHSIETRSLKLKNKRENEDINDHFHPILSDFENELKEAAKNSSRARTQVTKINREQQKGESEEKYKCTVLPTLGTMDYFGGFSAEEFDALKNESIEELHKKGVL